MIRPARSLRDALERGDDVSDDELDAVFPDELRSRSLLHWTPVDIALRAAALLAPSPASRVLDIGAGVGKLCLVGAAVTGATWWGVEQNPALVAAANHAAWSLELDARTRFVQGDGSRLPWDELDAIYFYNPFTTLMTAPHTSAFVRYATIQATLRRIEDRLAHARPGTRVVTYYGFGGNIPPGYTRTVREPAGGDYLELWLRD
ncbi:MAG TPA: class I SAM-dependent methyltransferase [Kofleriaceae bacterium]|jgi:SAM-dependent methyltransferase|nr:class I SAM-dependent methyltransferase [Kofleriaceae bacterium]